MSIIYNFGINGVSIVEKKKELISRAKKLIREYGVNFINDGVHKKWEQQAIKLITDIELIVKQTKTDKDYIKKVKYDSFKILKYYLKKLSKNIKS